MIKTITFAATLWVFGLSFFYLQSVVQSVPRLPPPPPSEIETRSVAPAPTEAGEVPIPIDLCPFGLAFKIDCHSCFCNNRSGIIGCTETACPLVDKPVFPWQSFIPKFSTSSGLTAAGRVARVDSVPTAVRIVKDPTATGTSVSIEKLVKDPSVPRVAKDPTTTGRVVAEPSE